MAAVPPTPAANHRRRRAVALAAATVLFTTPLMSAGALAPAAATDATVVSAASGGITAHWGDPSLTVGAPSTVVGVLSTGEVDRPLVVERAAADGSTTEVGSGVTAADGSYTLTFTHTKVGTFDYRVRALATDMDPVERVSEPVRFTIEAVTTSVTSRMSTGKTGLYKAVYLAGAINGGWQGATVKIQRKVPGGWLDGSKAVAVSGGAYKVKVPTSWYGAFSYRAVVTLSGGQEVTSPARALRVVPGYRPPGRAGQHTFFDRMAPRWNPCTTVRYKVNAQQSTPGALRDVKGAVRRVSQATGLRFVYTGKTTKIPQGTANDKHPANTDLVIAWAKPSQSRALGMSPHAAGVGGPLYYNSGFENGDGSQTGWIVRGSVVLNSTQKFRPGFGRGITRGELLMHEIAHATGLNHTMARTQVMYPMMQPTAARWGRGDLAGLARVGANRGCVFEGGKPLTMRASQLPTSVVAPLRLVADID